MTHRKFSSIKFMFVLFCLFLSSCSSYSQAISPTNPTSLGMITASPVSSTVQDAVSISTPASDNSTLLVQTEFSPIPVPETIIPTNNSAELALTPAQPPLSFHICSPLSLHPLSELREITSDPYRPPPPGKEERHHGIDFSYYRRGERESIQGVGVQSVLPGKVAASLIESYPYGNVVIIETPYSSLPSETTGLLPINEGQSLYTLYAHMDQPPLVSLDEDVSSCQALGEVGKSGNAFEPHLHLEMRSGPPNVTFTSMGFYRAQDTDEERNNYTRWRTGGEFLHFDPMLVLRDLVELLSRDQ